MKELTTLAKKKQGERGFELDDMCVCVLNKQGLMNRLGTECVYDSYEQGQRAGQARDEVVGRLCQG